MSNTFAAMKKARKKNFDAITKKLNEQSSGRQNKDERFWSPTVEKSGNGYAIVRALPAPKGEELPVVSYFNHYFKGPGGWYVETCPTTFGLECPVCEDNTRLWNEGNEDIPRQRKRNQQYVTNIYVLKDEKNSDSIGNVYLYRHGKKVFDKFNAKMHPEFEGEDEINPYDFWDGANFRIKVKTVKVGDLSFPNYDDSEFAPVGPLDEDEDLLKDIWTKEHSLAEWADPENCKSYEELKTRFDRVSRNSGSSSSAAESVDKERGTPEKEEDNSKMPWDDDDTGSEDDSDSSDSSDDNEDLAFFKDLAEED